MSLSHRIQRITAQVAKLPPGPPPPPEPDDGAKPPIEDMPIELARAILEWTDQRRKEGVELPPQISTDLLRPHLPAEIVDAIEDYHHWPLLDAAITRYKAEQGFRWPQDLSLDDLIEVCRRARQDREAAS